MTRLSQLCARVVGALTCVAMVGDALAGRPLATDDAGANKQGQCQVEGWQDRLGDGVGATHLAPACGVIDGLEIGFDLVHVTPSDEQSQARAFGFKWAPDWASWQGWRFGLRAGSLSEKAFDEHSWHQSLIGASALASLPLNEQWTLHLNLGRERNKLEQTSTNSHAAALVWTPDPRWQLFAEVLGHTSGPASQNMGLRWWLLPDKLGLDATAGRTNATPESRSWGIGIGWYGLSF